MTDKPLTDRILELPDEDGWLYISVPNWAKDDCPHVTTRISIEQAKSLARNHKELVSIVGTFVKQCDQEFTPEELAKDDLYQSAVTILARLRSAVEGGPKPENKLLTAIKAYLEPQPNDAQSERVHAELVKAVEEAERL